MPSMHIGLNAHLLSNEPGYRAAGIHRYIDQLLRTLPAFLPDDWQLTAMVGGANRATYDGIAMRRALFDTTSPLRRILWEQGIQPWQLSDFDLYHAMAFVAPFLLATPAVVTVYDLTFIRYPERLSLARRLYLRLFTALTCRRARRVIAISQSTANDLSRLLGIAPHKIDVTPLGYDAGLYRPLPAEEVAAFREQHGLPERFWLFLGTLEPRKNLPTLLAAYAALPRAERLPLVLAGGQGWGYDEIFAALDRYELHDDVHLPGFLPASDVPFWYNSAEVFVYPSVFEGFGLPVLEAMACGTPVITSNVSSLPEVAGEAGLCVPPDDVDAWTEALHTVLTDPSWRETARGHGLHAARQYTWQRTAQQTITSYRRALDQHG